MAPEGFTLFETAIGHCGVAWSPRGLVGVQLPEGRPAATRARMRRRWAEAEQRRPPKEVQAAVDSMVSLLAGRSADLSGVALDMDGVPTFHQRVYEVARTIPAGHTRTYGEIAAELGAPGSAQAVGQALGRNPFAIVVPCHRVVAAGGKTGGFSAKGGVTTKLRILAIEGASTLRPRVSSTSMRRRTGLRRRGSRGVPAGRRPGARPHHRPWGPSGSGSRRRRAPSAPSRRPSCTSS